MVQTALGGSGRAPRHEARGDPGDTGTGRSLLLTDSAAASSQPGGILVEKAHSSLLCQEGKTGQGCPAVPWDEGQECLATGHKCHQARGAKGQGAWAGSGWVGLPRDRLGTAGHCHCHGPLCPQVLKKSP